MSNLAAFPPSAFDSSGDFLSVAPATFPRAAFRVGCDFFSSRRCARLQAAWLPIFGGVSVMAKIPFLAAAVTSAPLFHKESSVL